jgi:hypothetical protein
MKWNFRLTLFWLLIVSAALVFNKAKANQYTIGPANDWVVKHALKQPHATNNNKIQDGTLYRLIDNQTFVPNNQKQQRHTRMVMQAINQSGVDYISQLSIDFDPSYQTLTLNSLAIIRKDERINKLKTAKFNVIQSESELSNRIYNGSLSLDIIIDDMRSGDMLDYSYTITGSNPIYGDKFSTRRTLSWSVPVIQQNMRVLWGKPTLLHVNKINGEINVKTSQLAQGLDFQISLFEEPLINSNSETPIWYSPNKQIYFSEYSQWSEVVNWALPLYKTAIETPPSITDIAKNIIQTHPKVEDQIAAALRFSQDEIRYLGLEMGTNSHQPTFASETLALRYGDCKDKAVLLISLLQAMNIDAYPALVDTDETKRLIELPPTASVFNHVIVTLETNNKRYWLDPTINYQRGSLEYLAQPNYGYALIINKGESALTSMQQTVTYNNITVEDNFYIAKHVSDSSQFTTQFNYMGFSAINRRSSVAKDGLTSVQKSYFEYYQDYFKQLSIKDEISVLEDEKTGQFITKESYEIGDFWEKTKDGYEASFYASEIQNSVYEPSQTNRTAPLYFNYPNNIDTTIKLHFNEQNWTFENNEEVIDNDFFSLIHTVRYSDNILTLHYVFSAKQDHIPAGQLSTYLAQREALITATYFPILKYANPDDIAKSTSNTQANTDLSWIEYTLYAYILAIVVFIVLWRIESAKRTKFEEALYYPVTPPKFLIYSILTMGCYISYWCYRNFKVIKERDNSNIIPIARGIFALIWYYPLYRVLVQDSEQQFSQNKVMPHALAIFLSILVLLSGLTYYFDEYALLFTLILPLLWLPLVSYISKHTHSEKAQTYNSKWRIHQIVISVIFLPLLLTTTLQKANLLPHPNIIKGDKMWPFQVHFLKRNRLIPENEDILYFYSDAMLNFKDDGNGITQNHIFSYFKNDNGEMESEISHFKDIDKIDVTYGKTSLNNTTIKVIKNNGDDFLLLVSNYDGQDKILITTINQRIKENKKPEQQ